MTLGAGAGGAGAKHLRTYTDLGPEDGALEGVGVLLGVRDSALVLDSEGELLLLTLVGVAVREPVVLFDGDSDGLGMGVGLGVDVGLGLRDGVSVEDGDTVTVTFGSAAAARRGVAGASMPYREALPKGLLLVAQPRGADVVFTGPEQSKELNSEIEKLPPLHENTADDGAADAGPRWHVFTEGTLRMETGIPLAGHVSSSRYCSMTRPAVGSAYLPDTHE